MRIEISMVLTAAMLGGVCGCEVGPNYRRPAIPVPGKYGELSDAASTRPSGVTASPAHLARWWTTFDDPELNSLVDRAIAGNLDLREAESRVREARYERDIAAADLWPTVNMDGGYQHARGSKNVTIPTSAFGGGAAKGTSGSAAPADRGIRPAAVSAESQGGGGGSSGAPAGPESPLGEGGFPGVSTDLFQIGFDASWEIDVFGGARRGVEAAEASTSAALEDQRDVLVTLLAEVARNYVELRGYQAEEAIARKNLASQEETLQLVQSKFKNGFVTDLDVSRQQEQVATTAASLPPIIAAERQAIHSLGILLGSDPDSLSQELSGAGPIPPTPPEVPVGLPSELLRRRPDVRRAERRLAAATAQIGVATADLFPKFNLSGSAGLDSTDPERLLEWNSRYYSIVPGVSWEVFDAGRIQANIHVQDELQRQALAAYQESVLTALKEVDDALVSYRTDQARRDSLADAVAAGRRATELAQEQYDRGVGDFLTVLDAERSVFADEDALVQSQRAVSDDLVALYKSLGGGWEQPSPPSSQPEQ